MCSEAAHLRDEKSSDGKSLSPGTVSPFSTRSRSASCATNIVGTPCLPPPNGVRLFRLEESRIWNEKTTHNTVHFSRIVVRIVSTALNVSLRPPPRTFAPLTFPPPPPPPPRAPPPPLPLQLPAHTPTKKMERLTQER